MRKCLGSAICAFLAVSAVSLEQSHLPDHISLQPDVQFRTTYPYSLISGGIRNAAEFEAVRANDALLEAHYATIGTLHPVMLPIDRWDYASYRIGAKIYWTSHRVRISAHELLFADDAGHEVRGRCGNRLSDTPQQPVAFVEPPELDKPRVEITMIPELPPELLLPTFPPTELEVRLPPVQRPETPGLTASELIPPQTTPTQGLARPPQGSILPTTPPGITGIPEPGTLWLFVAAALAACAAGRIRRR